MLTDQWNDGVVVVRALVCSKIYRNNSTEVAKSVVMNVSTERLKRDCFSIA